MASDERPPAQQRTGLSLYANLLSGGSSSTNDGQTISRAPVVFKQQTPEEIQKENDLAKLNAALKFQPTKRPQPAQKAKPKAVVQKSSSTTQNTSSPDPVSNSSAAAPPPPPPPPASVKTTLADWTGDGDEFGYYAGEKRQRGGRKKRKKNREENAQVQDWDDIYDPSRPNNYEDYKHSEEKFREIREWKDKLYAHRMKRRGSSEMSDDGPLPNKTFAPPSSYSFAPPPTFDDNDDSEPAPVLTEEAPPPPPEANVTNDATGDDAYARRMRMSGMAVAPLPPSSSPPPPPPPPPSDPPVQPTTNNATISRAPVRYQLPAADASMPRTDEELEAALADADAQEDPEDTAGIEDTSPQDQEQAPRTNRPGQKGFAQRLMAKYGWSKGSGLGATGTGIINPLRVQVEKRKKKSDAEGGGWVGPSAKGKIIGSKYGKDLNAPEDAGPKDGEEEVGLSEVVILKGMVDGMDLDAEMRDGGLMQDIGEECGEKYGTVERVFIHLNSSSASTPVFVKFTSQLSALRAVQALQGRTFNGNVISARFFDVEKFESGVYE